MNTFKALVVSLIFTMGCTELSLAAEGEEDWPPPLSPSAYMFNAALMGAEGTVSLCKQTGSIGEEQRANLEKWTGWFLKGWSPDPHKPLQKPSEDQLNTFFNNLRTALGVLKEKGAAAQDIQFLEALVARQHERSTS